MSYGTKGFPAGRVRRVALDAVHKPTSAGRGEPLDAAPSALEARLDRGEEVADGRCLDVEIDPLVGALRGPGREINKSKVNVKKESEERKEECEMSRVSESSARSDARESVVECGE